MKLTVGWLYPELMSTYGDRGNIIIFKKRATWRKITVTVLPIIQTTTPKQIASCSIIFGGGAQDRQQTLVVQDLLRKREQLQTMFTEGTPGLFVCGSPQLLGHSYVTGTGENLPGLGIFDMTSRHPGLQHPRCIGNTVSRLDADLFEEIRQIYPNPELVQSTIVGFENHGGRTYLGEGVRPLAKVLVGSGNNGSDKTEGAIYRHCLATYSHGPFLAKNPHVADWLLSKALHRQYGEAISLTPLNDEMSWQAHLTMAKRLQAI